MCVPWVGGSRGQSLRGQLGAQRKILQVRIVGPSAIHYKGAVLQPNGCQRGACCTTRVLWVKGQRVASTEHEGHTLTDRHRLEQLDNVGMRGAEHADVINVDYNVA